jgi:hypothetical protein
MEVFFAWEKLRVVFNAIYGAGIFCFMSGLKGPLPENFVAQIATITFLVNATISMGSVFEGYLCWMGARRMPAKVAAAVTVNAASIMILVIWQHG